VLNSFSLVTDFMQNLDLKAVLWKFLPILPACFYISPPQNSMKMLRLKAPGNWTL